MKMSPERQQEWRFRIGSWLIARAISLVSRTVRLVVHNDAEMRQRQAEGKPKIVVGWHGRTLLPLWLYGRKRWIAMISLSRDGEYQARIFDHLGWQVIRGSTGRGGARAAVATTRALRAGGTLAFTPDGPRGPLHVVHPGVLFFSQKANCPIYPLGVSVYPRRVLPTWDRYLLPYPFARASIRYGEPMTVPKDATAADLERYAIELARRICVLEEQAEADVTPLRARLASRIADEKEFHRLWNRSEVPTS